MLETEARRASPESSVVDQPLDYLPARLLRDPAALASGPLRRPSFPDAPATLSPHEPL